MSKKPMDWAMKRDQCILEQIHAVSDDFKEMCRMSDAQTARNIGIGLVTGLTGWFAGPVIARRFITKRPLVARNIARGAVFGGLCWSGFRVNEIYSTYLRWHHPQSVHHAFVAGQLYLMAKVTEHLSADEEKQYRRELLANLTTVMKREPLYRNQSELKDLISVSNQALQLLLEIYDHAPESLQEHFKVYFDQLYYWPSIRKVYGIKIENYEDMDMFAGWLKEQEGETKKVKTEDTWSLNAPEKAEDFWEWFNDKKTGKPIPRGRGGQFRSNVRGP